jgi:hypothetical protein
VVADVVAGAAVVVDVVVEGGTSVLRGGGEGVVDAGMADDKLLQALFAIDGFGGEGVADELGVEVAGMVGPRF